MAVRVTSSKALSAASTVIMSVACPLMAGPSPGPTVTAPMVDRFGSKVRFEPIGPGRTIGSAPAPDGTETTIPDGRPCPAWIMSRTSRSIATRRLLFMLVTCRTLFCARVALVITENTPPMTSDVTAMLTRSSTSEKPRRSCRSKSMSSPVAYE